MFRYIITISEVLELGNNSSALYKHEQLLAVQINIDVCWIKMCLFQYKEEENGYLIASYSLLG